MSKTDVKIVALDFETTGVDVFRDRVVTATISEFTSTGECTENYEWLVNPGIPIPEEATNVHGVTDEMAEKSGVEPALFVDQFLAQLDSYPENTPLVIMNASFDLSMLYHEALRYGQRFDFWRKFNLIDPRVLDLTYDKWRKGSRKLVNLAEYYGVPVDEERAHDSTYDNYLAANVAIQIVRKYQVSNAQLRQQPEMYREWAEGFEKYLRKSDPSARISREWPVQLKEEK